MQNHKRRAVAWWLIAGVIMIIVQTLLGGVTRLTGSGLSITKWNPIFGILPPLNARQWNDAFDGYKQIGQFKYMNSGYTLEDFKGIFFWEWLHRFWARMLGIVFLVGFVYFLVRRYFDRQMIRPFIILFLLGALQGLIGWVMVASGLNDSHLYVDHIKLALHFVSAMVLACYTLWFALLLLVPGERRTTNSSLHTYTLLIIIVLFVQLTYGAFMAGLKAAMAAATWPTINGMWLPDTLARNSLISDKLNVHFIHRGIAYILLLLLTTWFFKARKAITKGVMVSPNQDRVMVSSNQDPVLVSPNHDRVMVNPNQDRVMVSLSNHDHDHEPLLHKTMWWPFLLVLLQVTLGITTLLMAPTMVPGHFGTFEVLAEAHQLVAMFLLMSMVVNLYVVRRN